MFWWPFARNKKKRNAEKKAKSFGATTPVRSEKPDTPRAISSPGPQPPAVPANFLAGAHTSRPSLEKPPLKEPEEQHPAERRGSDEDITVLPTWPTTEKLEKSPRLRSLGTPRWTSQAMIRGTDSITDEQRRPVSTQGPTTHNTIRRKFSKKKKRDDREREDEIRALSRPIPIPKRADTQDSAVPSRRISKRRMSLQPRQNTEPPGNGSLVSLNSPGSMRSGITGKISDSWHHWDVGALDMLSPRPKIRYSMTQYAPDSMQALGQSRTGSSKGQRKDWSSSRTIDEMAEEYDASTIRELMDRDARRLEKKQKYEEEKARKRLERHAVRKQEGSSGAQATDPGEESSRAFEGLGLQGANAGPSSPVEARAPRKRDSHQPTLMAASPTISDHPYKEPEATDEAKEAIKAQPQVAPEPTAESTPVDTVEPAEPLTREQDIFVPPASSAAPSPPISPFAGTERKSSYISTVSDARNQSLQDLAESGTAEASGRRASDIGSKRTGALASLFRRSKRVSGEYGKEPPTSEKSFSNTSRESMARQPLPAHLVAPPPSAKRRSGTPQRTVSKFREDLPESPASRSQFGDDGGIPSSATSEARRDSRVFEGRTDSMSSAVAPSATGLSQSLASVDSEASWLTGARNPRRRTSQQMVPTTGSVAENEEDFSVSYEDLGRPDEEAFKSHVTRRQRAGSNRVDPLLEDDISEHDESQADATLELEENVEYGTAARQPVYVHRHGSATSREGILQQVAAEGKSGHLDVASGAHEDDERSFVSGFEDATPNVEEVRTVSHARQVSSGSARLLDIPARRDSKRTSVVSIGNGAGSSPTIAAGSLPKDDSLVESGPGPSQAD